MARMPYTAPAGIKSAFAEASDGKTSAAEAAEGKNGANGSGHAPPVCCVRNPKG
jgi:hypothetical protein